MIGDRAVSQKKEKLEDRGDLKLFLAFTNEGLLE